LAALLEGELTPPALDGALVASAREVLAQRPLAERVYAVVKREAERADLSEWRPTDRVKDVARYFTRRSGAPMTAGMPGLFTYDGYNSEFLVRVPEFARKASQETWVVGSANMESLDDADVSAVTESVLDLYFDDYVRQWQAYLDDVDVIPFRSFAEAAEVSKVLSDVDSPIKGYLAAVSEETRLARLPGDVDAGGGVTGRIGELIKLLPGVGADALAANPAYRVNRQFEDIRQILIPPQEGAAPPIDGTLALVNELYAHLTAMRNAASPPAAEGASVLVRLRQVAGRSPSPLSRWLRTLAQQSSLVAVRSVRGRLNEVWTGDIAPFCRTALRNRYPLARGSREDSNLGDFARYFGPQGLVDGFVSAELKPYVDTSVRPWREVDMGGVQLGISEESLRAIEGAARVKEAFFAGGATPLVRFALKPLELDKYASQVQLELGGQRLTYRHGPTRLENMQWPPPDGSMLARLVFTPLGGSTAGASLTSEGPWALFRLLDKGNLRRVSSSVDRFRVTFRVDGLTAIFELKAASVANPFRLGSMAGLQCLEKL
jgi:type VI secretion system protein ImpL